MPDAATKGASASLGKGLEDLTEKLSDTAVIGGRTFKKALRLVMRGLPVAGSGCSITESPDGRIIGSKNVPGSLDPGAIGIVVDPFTDHDGPAAPGTTFLFEVLADGLPPDPNNIILWYLNGIPQHDQRASVYEITLGSIGAMACVDNDNIGHFIVSVAVGNSTNVNGAASGGFIDFS